MGLSTSKSTKKVDTKTTENATTTPTYSPAVQSGLDQFGSQITGYGANRPASEDVAPTSPLQNRAFDMALSLGGGQRYSQAGNPLYGASTTQNAGIDMSPVSGNAYTNNGIEPGRSSSLPQPNSGGMNVTSVNPGAFTTNGFGPASNGYGQSYDTAANLALGAATAGPNLAGSAGYNGTQADVFTWGAPTVQGGQIGSPVQANVPGIGGATQANMPQLGGAVQANMPQMGDIAAWQASLVNPASLGMSGPGQAGNVNFGAAGSAGAASFGPAGQAANVNLDPAAQAAARSTLASLPGLENRYIEDVVNTTLTGIDRNADIVRARQQADAAGSGAFRGSRDAITRSMTEEGLARERAAQEAALRFGAQDRALGLASQEADRFTDVSKTNAGFSNDRNLAQGRISADIGISNAGNVTQRNIAEGRANADIGISNANNATQMGIAQGRANTDIGISNARNVTDYGLGAGDIAARVAQGNQNALNSSASDYARDRNVAGRDVFNRGTDAALQYAGDTNAFARDRYGRESDAALQFSDASNAFTRDEYGRLATAAQSFADTGNQFTRDQFLTDADRYRAQADLDARSRSENAGAFNSTANQNANRRDAGLSFTADSYRRNQEFNAGMRETALGRQISGANSIGSLAGSYADQYRGDTALTGALGEQQRTIDQQQRLAELSRLQALTGMYGPLAQLQQGRTVNSSGTLNGTEVTRSNPGVFQSLLQLGQQAAQAYTMGASERRVKRDIERVDTLPNGLGLYRFNYLWDAKDRKSRLGVMVDEVARIVPEALGPVLDMFGFRDVQTVNYRALGFAHLVEA